MGNNIFICISLDSRIASRPFSNNPDLYEGVFHEYLADFPCLGVLELAGCEGLAEEDEV